MALLSSYVLLLRVELGEVGGRLGGEPRRHRRALIVEHEAEEEGGRAGPVLVQELRGRRALRHHPALAHAHDQIAVQDRLRTYVPNSSFVETKRWVLVKLVGGLGWYEWAEARQ